tara:strand:+ start:3885 stop:4349 length:465 start_codon:yes stop_codon:yes gene_type:complete
MKKIALFISFLFLTLSSNLSYAEELYFECKNNQKWKYEKGFFGGKVYYEYKNNWVLIKNTEIQEDKLIIKNNPLWNFPNKNKSCKPSCDYTTIISLLVKGIRNSAVVEHTKVVDNDCWWWGQTIVESWGEACHSYKAGMTYYRGTCVLMKPLKP